MTFDEKPPQPPRPPPPSVPIADSAGRVSTVWFTFFDAQAAYAVALNAYLARLTAAVPGS